MECTGDKLHAAYPGSSPYVTAVGATQLVDAEFDMKNPPPVCKNLTKALGPGYECASGGKE